MTMLRILSASRVQTIRALLLGSVAASSAALAAVPFETIEVAYEQAQRERIWDGTVEAVNQATVSAQTSGRVAEILFDVNDFVEAGAVIMRFTATEQRAALAATRAAAEEAQARFARGRERVSAHRHDVRERHRRQSALRPGACEL